MYTCVLQRCTYSETKALGDERAVSVEHTVLEVDEHGAKTENVETGFLERLIDMAHLDLLATDNSVITHTGINNLLLLSAQTKHLGLGVVNHEQERDDTKQNGNGTQDDHDPLPGTQTAGTVHVADTVANEATKGQGNTIANVDDTNTTSLFLATVKRTDEHDTTRVDAAFKETKQETHGSQLGKVVAQESQEQNDAPKHNDSANVHSQSHLLDQDHTGRLEEEIAEVEDGAQPTELLQIQVGGFSDTEHSRVVEGRLVKELHKQVLIVMAQLHVTIGSYLQEIEDGNVGHDIHVIKLADQLGLGL